MGKHAAKTISKRAQNDLIMSEKYARQRRESQLYLTVSMCTRYKYIHPPFPPFHHVATWQQPLLA